MGRNKKKDNMNFKNIEEQSKEEDFDQPKVEYLNYIINRSKIIHMWPQERKSSFLQSLAHHFIVWTIFINCSILISTLLLKIAIDYKNVDEIAGTIDLATVFISGTFRYMYIYFRGKTYLKIVSTLHNNFIYYSLFPSKKRASIEKYETLAKRLVFAYTIFTSCWLFQLVFLPLIKYAKVISSNRNDLLFNVTKLDNEYPLPLKAYIPFDVSQLPSHIVHYIFQGVVTFIMGIIYVNVDSFWVTIIVLTIGQFDLIKESTDTLMKNENDRDTVTEAELLDKNDTEDVEAKLTKCIQHHEFIKRFVRFTEEVFSPNVLVNAFHSILSITFILLEMIVHINSESWKRFLNSVQYLLISIVHMFAYDWLGNELLVKEEEMRHAIYNLPWYKYPSQKTKIILILNLSKNSHKLTGGKMYKMTLEFFITTMKIILSYFSFLLQIRDRH